MYGDCCMYRYSIYVCMHSHQSTDRSGKVPKPARGHLNKENEYFRVPVRP